MMKKMYDFKKNVMKEIAQAKQEPFSSGYGS